MRGRAARPIAAAVLGLLALFGPAAPALGHESDPLLELDPAIVAPMDRC